MFKKWQSIRLIMWGNTLEMFDIFLYIHLSFLISEKFFAPGFEKTKFFTAFTFTQLYLIAPISCIIFAYLGDKHGRKQIIIKTALIMAIASFAIVLLPTYETWGENATILLLMLRLIQSIALSGEPTAANLYMIESTSLSRDEVWYKQAPWCIAIMNITENVGGLIALLLGYVSLSLFKNYTHGWRIPFIFCSVFVIFIAYIRTKLTESDDYEKETSNQTLSIFDEQGMSSFYKSIMFYYRNTIYWIMLLIPYPIVFNIGFLQISPLIIKRISGSSESLLIYNSYVSVGVILLFLLWAYLPLKYKWNLKRTVSVYVIIGSLFASLGIWCMENYFNIYLIYICQILLLSLISFSVLLRPGILKTFPVIGRYSLMGIGWGIARIINFFLIVFVMTSIQSAFGLYGSLLLLYVVTGIGLYAVYAHVSYDELDSASFRETLKNAQPVEGEYNILKSEEAHDYVIRGTPAANKITNPTKV